MAKKDKNMVTSGKQYTGSSNFSTNTQTNTQTNTSNGVSYTQYKSDQGLWNQYQKAAKAKPKYDNPYEDRKASLLNNIQNRKFEYDLNSDALYKQYADQYRNLGQQAMEDTMANASALSGGFGNSYAATAGQQAYNSYLQQLNDIVPQLYAQARSTYDSETSELYNQANLLDSLSARKFEEYQAALNQYNQDKQFNYNAWHDNYLASGKTVSSQTDTSRTTSTNTQSSRSNQTTVNKSPYTMPSSEDISKALQNEDITPILKGYGYTNNDVMDYDTWWAKNKPTGDYNVRHRKYRAYLSKVLSDKMDFKK